MSRREKYSIGVDIGGTNTVFGVVDREGSILREATIKTQDYPDIHDFVEASAKCVSSIAEYVGGVDSIYGVGIGAPAGNNNTGCLDNPANLPWKGVTPLAQLFSERLGIPVRVSNDAKVAALGEMYYGAARGMTDFMLITLGTGIGSGIVVNGQLVCGHDGLAGELGHIRVDNREEARPCGCGRRGCLECYCSASGIVKTAQELLVESEGKSLLGDIAQKDITSLDIYEAAKQGDEIARETFRRVGKVLGEACADFSTFSSPEAYIFFGGPMHASEFIMPSIREAYDSHVLFLYRGKAKLLVSELMDKNVAILGAAALVHNLQY